MTESKNTAPHRLHQKIAEIVQAVDHVAKDGRNNQQNYSYVSEAGFLEAVRGEMADRGITVHPRVLPETVVVHDRSASGDKGFVTTCVVGYTFTDAETGESFTAEVLTQGFDSLDKGAFKAMTGGIKYALRQTFLIPTGDDAESDGGSSGERAEDSLQMGVLPPEQAFPATIREAKWVKAKGKDKIVAVVGVANSNGGADAGETVWLEPGRPEFNQFVQNVCAGTIPEVGAELAHLVGKALTLTVSLNGQYRNYTIGAPAPQEVAA